MGYKLGFFLWIFSIIANQLALDLKLSAGILL